MATLQQLKDGMAKDLFGMTQDQAYTTMKCISCKKDVIEFRDKQSRREYEISGFCQECQDVVFGG